MNWSAVRDTLSPKCENFKDFGHYDKISKKDRTKILAENNYSCRYCGGIYSKYLMSTYIPSVKSSDIACRACYLITHLNYGNYTELRVYYSTMSQLDIVKKTVDYIIDNDEVPLPNIIDPNIKTSPLSILEFINVLNNYSDEPVPEILSNYKIFFSNKLNTDFITSNYGNQFIQPANNGKNQNKNFKMVLDKHKMSKKEFDLFTRLLK